MAEIGQNISYAAELLRAGELVAIPTETVYGLAANALSESAVDKIFKAKKRPYTDPLIVHIGHADLVENFAHIPHSKARALMESFWPGPLTLLLPKKKNIPDLVTNGSEKVALRMPNHPLTLQLLRQLDFPLAAPSANPFGGISPTTPEHVNKGLGNVIPYILDGGPCTVGVESTIVDFSANGELKVLRQGGISEETLEQFFKLSADLSEKTPITPGSMLSHYAPQKPLFMGRKDQLFSKYQPGEIGVLAFGVLPAAYHGCPAFQLSERADLEEAARNLFAGLHYLDELEKVKVIVGPEIPNFGLGKAINDRLRRASAKSSLE